jgi:pyroglutamyl-peptidase
MGQKLTRWFWAFSFMTSISAFSQTRILISSFEPFMGRSTNASIETSQKIKTLLESGGQYSVDLVTLPVTYKGADQTLIQYFESLTQKPDLVISLGEAECETRYETRSENLDDVYLPDNAGAIRINQPIIQGAPHWKALTYPIHKMVSATPIEFQTKIHFSTSAGNYICNHLAYLMTDYLSKQNIPYGFIHVPSNTCSKRPSVQSVAQEISTVLRQFK